MFGKKNRYGANHKSAGDMKACKVISHKTEYLF